MNTNLLREEKRTLRKMHGRIHVSESEIYNCRKLYELDLIVKNHSDEVDPFGAPVPDGTYRLSEEYWRYREGKKWFNSEYVVSHLVIPVLVAVLAAIITSHVLL